MTSIVLIRSLEHLGFRFLSPEVAHVATVRALVFVCDCFQKLKFETHCSRHRKEIRNRFMVPAAAANSRIMTLHRELPIVSTLTPLPPTTLSGVWVGGTCSYKSTCPHVAGARP